MILDIELNIIYKNVSTKYFILKQTIQSQRNSVEN